MTKWIVGIASILAAGISAPVHAQQNSGDIAPVNGTCPEGYELRIRGQQIAQQGYSGTRVCSPYTQPQVTVRPPVGADAVVKIWISCRGKTWTGAGVLVSRQGHILTAGHLGSACIGDATTQIEVGPVRDAYREPVVAWTAKLLGRMADGKADPSLTDVTSAAFQDVALYQIDDFDGYHPTINLALSYPVAGDDISIAGFADMPFEYEKSENTRAGYSVVKGSLLSVAARDGVPFRLHTASMTLPGLSGGPVTDASGALIGIHAGLRTANPNFFAWATAVTALPRSWLDIIIAANRP